MSTTIATTPSSLVWIMQQVTQLARLNELVPTTIYRGWQGQHEELTIPDGTQRQLIVDILYRTAACLPDYLALASETWQVALPPTHTPAELAAVQQLQRERKLFTHPQARDTITVMWEDAQSQWIASVDRDPVTALLGKWQAFPNVPDLQARGVYNDLYKCGRALAEPLTSEQRFYLFSQVTLLWQVLPRL